jgi:hypothetical protein
MKTPIKNKNFDHIDYVELGIIDPTIMIIYYPSYIDEEDEIFAGIRTDFYPGDGIEDTLYTDIITLKNTHKLSPQGKWYIHHPLGRDSTETKFASRQIPIRDIQIEKKSKEQEMLEASSGNLDDDLGNNVQSENLNGNNNLLINDFLMFTPKDSKISLDEAMKLWINSGTNNF